MNQRTILSISTFTVFGLIIGYAVFGKLGGEYVSLKTLFSFGGNAISRAFQSISGLEDMRNRILLCGVAGGVIGILATFRLKR
jgi:hypothetical protein